MSVEGQTLLTYTISAGEDLNDVTKGTGDIWKAVALDDGKVAANGNEAGGILREPGKAGSHVTLNMVGESKFTAAGALVAGRRVTVTTSGYMTGVVSGSYAIGRVLNPAVASGAVGRGVFDFSNPVFITNCFGTL
jgi:hypothetical protein